MPFSERRQARFFNTLVILEIDIFVNDQSCLIEGDKLPPINLSGYRLAHHQSITGEN